MAFEFKLPDIGEGVTEGEIVKWLVREGDAVTEDQPIVEIMTDKATVEIPITRQGTVKELLAKVGDVVPVGSALVRIEEGAVSTVKKETPAHVEKSPAAPAPSGLSMTPTTAASTMTRVLASPATRKMAREMGVDLNALQGSGPAGRVTAENLKSGGAMRAGAPRAAKSATAPMPTFGQRTTPVPTGGEERIPLRGVRRKIAEHMAKSIHTAAHFTHVDECDMTELVDLREKSKASAEARGIKLTYWPFILRAICTALKKYPTLNASLDDEKSEIVLKYSYNIGVSVATNDGDLIVPVVKNADRRTILELAADIQALSEKAKTGKIAPDDIRGGTFTVTSTGNLGGLLATPIINYPEVAILGFHQIQPRAVVRDDQIVIRKMCYFSISLDHRVVDGAVGASFLTTVIRLLEDPKLLLVDG